MDKKLFEIASKVAKPISLASVMVIALYLIYRTILGLDIFSTLEENSTFILVRFITDRVFYLALITSILGVGSYLYVRYLGNQPKRAYKKIIITGNALFSDGHPVKGAIVFVEGVDRRKETDTNGWFQVEVNEQTSWTVRALYEGTTASAIVKRRDVQKPVILTFSSAAPSGVSSQEKSQEGLSLDDLFPKRSDIEVVREYKDKVLDKLKQLEERKDSFGEAKGRLKRYLERLVQEREEYVRRMREEIATLPERLRREHPEGGLAVELGIAGTVTTTEDYIKGNLVLLDVLPQVTSLCESYDGSPEEFEGKVVELFDEALFDIE